jgi:hypothetical protein
MKFKSGLLIFSFLATVLTGCNSGFEAPVQPLVQVQDSGASPSDITIQSDMGLFEFISATQKALFKAYDKNKDGFVTKNELSGIIQEEFDSIDLDHNGKITFRESHQSFFFFEREVGSKLFRSLLDQLFGQYIDKDGDSMLSRDEFLGFYLQNTTDPSITRYFKTSFSKNDVNKDGLLNFSEYEDAMYQMFKRDIKVEILDNGYVIIFG